jgi:hypothetical protein
VNARLRLAIMKMLRQVAGDDLGLTAIELSCAIGGTSGTEVLAELRGMQAQGLVTCCREPWRTARRWVLDDAA